MNNYNLTENDLLLLQTKYPDLESVQKKLDEHYPVQYLIGDVNFYGYKILVNKDVLIPRFETEYLVEKTINYIKKYNLTTSNILEIGVGSACISIALKKELPKCFITAIDKSKRALKIAKKNAELNSVDIELKEADVFNYYPNISFDVLISNPPYIGKSEIIDESCKYEPKMALYAKEEGLEFYKHIIATSKQYLNKKNIIAFEIGCTQGPFLKEYAKRYFPDAHISIEKDLALRDRYLFIINE